MINATFDSTITSDPNAALIESTINQAVSFYESMITNPLTVNIVYAEMASGLGQSSTYYESISYSQYLAALQSHSSGDATDTSALASLTSGPNNPVNGSTSIDVTTANLRALGLSGSVSTDSTISLNTSITNYNGKTFSPSNYDLLAVVEHETDEALGLGSNLDTLSTSGAIRPEDLFRYSASGVRSYSTSSSATAYFSVDGGATNLAGFNQSGGGTDFGDWDSTALRVQNAYGTPGGTPTFRVEKTALDAIGYNFTTVAVAPEPGTFWLISTGAIAVLGGRKALRKRNVL